MTDSKVLATAMRRRQDTHGNTAQDVCTYQLAYGLSLITTVVHPHILKCTFLGAKSGHLRKRKTLHKHHIGFLWDSLNKEKIFIPLTDRSFPQLCPECAIRWVLFEPDCCFPPLKSVGSLSGWLPSETWAFPVWLLRLMISPVITNNKPLRNTLYNAIYAKH